MKRSASFVFGPMLAVLLLAAPARSATIGFSPQTILAAVGDSFLLDVVVSDLAGEIVSAYDLDIVFDAAVIQLDSISLSDALGAPSLFEAFLSSSTGPGLADLAGVSLLSDAALLARQGGASVTLATLGFTRTGTDDTTLDFVLDAFNDVKGAQARILDLAVRPGTVGSPGEAPIPEPGASLAFAVGLLTLGGALHRRRPSAGDRLRGSRA